jgi:hypothetical protein
MRVRSVIPRVAFRNVFLIVTVAFLGACGDAPEPTRASESSKSKQDVPRGLPTHIKVSPGSVIEDKFVSEWARDVLQGTAGQRAKAIDTLLAHTSETRLWLVAEVGDGSSIQLDRPIRVLASLADGVAEGSREFLDYLLQLSRSPNPKIRSSAASRLSGRYFFAPWVSPLAADASRRVIEMISDPNAEVRAQAVGGLDFVHATSEARASVIASVVNDSDENVSLAALGVVERLGLMKDGGVSRTVGLAASASPFSEVRRRATALLGGAKQR